MDNIPVLSVDLIKELDRIYPQIPVRPDANINNIMFSAGQRSVIEFLLTRLKQSIEDGLSE